MATDRIAIRTDTASNWTSADPTLAEGEQGHETDTGRRKVGDGTTAWTSLAYVPYIINTDVVGMIAAFGTPSAPSGWLECDGDAVSRTTYERLFDAIGTTWGSGDGSTTFNLPDMREVAPVGIGTRGEGAAADVYTLGEFKDDQMQQITGDLTNTLIRGSSGDMVALGAFSDSFDSGEGASPSSGENARRIDFNSANSPDARTGTVTRGKRIGTLYCIKY